MKFKKGYVIELTPKNFTKKDTIIKHPKLKDKKGMVLFASEHCFYCVQFAPVYEDVALVLGTSFPMFYFDCNKYRDFAVNNLKIQGFPTVQYINRKGEIYKNYTGNRDVESIIKSICSETKS